MKAGAAVAAAMASHGLLDMMTNGGVAVAYLWPLSSTRLFADCRPIHSSEVHLAHLLAQAAPRHAYELVHLIVPMFVIALLLRAARTALGKRRAGDDAISAAMSADALLSRRGSSSASPNVRRCAAPLP